MKTLQEWKDYFAEKYPNAPKSQIDILAQKQFDKQNSSAPQEDLISYDDSGIDTSDNKISIGFGLTDANGNPAKLSPAELPTYTTGLLLKDPKGYAKLQAAVYKATGRKYTDSNLLGTYLQGLAQNIIKTRTTSPELGDIGIETLINAGIANRATNPLTGGKTKPGAYVSISGETQAQKTITDVWKKELDREPTADEVIKYTKKLQKAQEKNPTQQVYEIVDGKSVQRTITGLNEVQFLTNLIRKLPEYSTKTAEAAKIKDQNRQLNLQKLTETAFANNVDLNTVYGSAMINSWLDQIENGAKVETFQNTIRSTASLGKPKNVKDLMATGVDLETIYAPYKRVMASILEINPESISPNDPLLNSAITENGEESISNFQVRVRQDPRWPKTQNAREVVSNAILGVFQDFGVQG